MKRRVVEWIIFIILYSLSERAFISSSEAAVHDIKPLMKEKELKDVFNKHQTSFKSLHEAAYLKDVQREMKVIVDHNKKGKGSYGGGDLLRPRSKKSGVTLCFLNPIPSTQQHCLDLYYLDYSPPCSSFDGIGNYIAPSKVLKC